jgi:hypothetical protein
VTQTLFPDEGAKARDQGMKIASDHANAANEDWTRRAYQALMRFKLYGNREFTAEDARDWCERNTMLPKPPDPRAWGGVIAIALKNGMIERLGYVPAKMKHAHCCPKSLWKWL